MITHLRGWKILQKDQARRLRWQEKQRIQQKMVNAPNTDRTWGWNQELSEGQLKSFSAKLIK